MLDEQKLQQIMQAYAEKLLRLAYFYTKNAQAAEDIVQDIFITFYYTKHYREQGELQAYLTRMTVNKCYDYLKSWSYRMLVFKEKLDFTKSVHTDQMFLRHQEEYEVEQAILSLPLKLREPIVYFYYEEMKIKDIAQLLEIPEGTVKTRLTRAKQLLKESLSNIEWEVLLHD